MIISTIATDNNNGYVVTFGLATAVAVIALLAVSSLRPSVTSDEELLAEQIEGRIEALTTNGAPEVELRALVGDAVRFGRGRAGR